MKSKARRIVEMQISIAIIEVKFQSVIHLCIEITEKLPQHHRHLCSFHLLCSIPNGLTQWGTKRVPITPILYQKALSYGWGDANIGHKYGLWVYWGTAMADHKWQCRSISTTKAFVSVILAVLQTTDNSVSWLKAADLFRITQWLFPNFPFPTTCAVCSEETISSLAQSPTALIWYMGDIKNI